jgi:hypothetical protein
MFRKVFDMLRGASPFEIMRGGDQTQRSILQFACHQPAIGQRTEADRQIVTFRHQINVAIGDAKFELDFRIGLHEAVQHRRQPVMAVGRRHAYADMTRQRDSRRPLNRPLGIIDH